MELPSPRPNHPFACFPRQQPPSPSENRRRASRFLRSLALFSASTIDHSGPIAFSGALSHSGPIKLGSSPTPGSRGHSSYAFTMIPLDVVGRTTPPGYETHEPTSPEVTCMGTVRRKKPCKAADDKHKLTSEAFLANRKEKLRLESVSDSGFWAEKKQHVLQSSQKSKQSRWKHLWAKREFDRQTESNAETSQRFSPDSESCSGVHDFEDASSSPSSREFPASSSEINLKSTTAIDIPSQVPPPNSLLLIRNSSCRRSKEFPDSEAVSFASDSPSSTGSNANEVRSIWKRRGTPELSQLQIKARAKLESRLPFTN